MVGPPAAAAPAVVAANPALVAADVAPAMMLLAGTEMTSPDRRTVYEASGHDRVVTVRTPRVTVAGRFRKANSRYWLTDGRIAAADTAETEDTEIAAWRPITGTFLPARKMFTDTKGEQPGSLDTDELVLPVSADPKSGKTTFTLVGDARAWSILTSALSPVPMLECWLPRRGGVYWVKQGDTAARSLTVDEILENPSAVEARHAPSDRIVEAGSAGFRALPPGELFPAGSPKAADVRQSGLGTCHLQAVLIELAERDPAYLRTEVIKPAGANYSVRFFAKHSATTAFVPERVLVDATLPTDAAGQPLYSAGVNWARLIEKAFAVFAATHGLEGMAYATPPAAVAGYAGIEGGQSHPLYRVFYGADAAVSDTPMAFNRSAPGLGVTPAAVNELVKFAHPEAGQKRFLTAAGDVASHVDRAIAEADATALPDAHGPQLETFKIKLAAAKRDLASTARLGSQRNSIASVREMRAAAATMAVTLAAYAPLPLLELCLDLQASGDSSTGSRFIYGGHAYAVTAATVVMTDGTTRTRPLAATDLATVDFAASRVTLRNPHRMHVPQGVTGSETGADAGRFELTLEQFMRNFDKVQGGVVTRTAVAQ